MNWRAKKSRYDSAQYRRDGWAFGPKVFDEATVLMLRGACDRLMEGAVDHPIPERVRPYLQDVNRGRRSLCVITHAAYRSDAIKRALVNSRVGEVASRLSGHSTLRLFNSALVFKPSRFADAPSSEEKIDWHRDSAYFETCSCDDMITAWIPLQPTVRHSGSLSVKPGTHGVIDDQAAADLKSFITCDGSESFDGALDLSVESGQAVYLHARLLHTTRENLDLRDRYALVFFLQSGGNTYLPPKMEAAHATRHTNDLLCRKTRDGHPDYADPVFCPVVWPQPGMAL